MISSSRLCHDENVPASCRRRADLAKTVEEVLQKITQLTKRQLAAFRRHDEAELMRLDKQLELTVGLKERSIGALRQHEKEHGCQF